MEELSKKTIVIPFYGRFPSEKAASLFLVKSADAFAELGYNVKILIPKRRGAIVAKPGEYYKTPARFEVVPLSVPLDQLYSKGEFFFYLSWFFFSLAVLKYARSSFLKDTIFYSNETMPLLFLSFFFPHIFYEMHDYPGAFRWAYRFFFRRTRGLVVTNSWKRKELNSSFGVSSQKILVEPNAFEPEAFMLNVTREEAREKLGLSLGKKIVVYTGHLFGWKGVDTLAHAAKLLPEGYLVIFVGGTNRDARAFQEKYRDISNMQVIGFRQHAEIPIWQTAADVLVLPNTAKDKISKYYTSPMKLFEYMASNRPIVASRLPSIEEVLSERNAELVEPDNPQALASSIERVIISGKGDILAGQAREDVKEHTWQKRAKRISVFLERDWFDASL